MNPEVVLYAASIYGVMIAYLLIYSRHQLVARAPDEEFALIQRAEARLARGGASKASAR